MVDEIFSMELIAIGRISRPIGIRGEVKILPLTIDNHRFSGLETVWVGADSSNAEQRQILNVRIEAKHLVLSLQGTETTQEAEKLRNKYLFIPKEKIVKLPRGSYFIDDVIGCEVVTEEQVVLGTIADMLSLPANDVWVVRNGSKEILIPAVKAVVRNVDVLKKRVTIHALEGLLD
jgi:16S rRNA processing protein RimM